MVWWAPEQNGHINPQQLLLNLSGPPVPVCPEGASDHSSRISPGTRRLAAAEEGARASEHTRRGTVSETNRTEVTRESLWQSMAVSRKLECSCHAVARARQTEGTKH